MNVNAIHRIELLIRSVARWGSIAAAVIFGVAFATDREMSWYLASHQMVQIGLIVAVFACYTLAWMPRFELVGSVGVLMCMIAFCADCKMNSGSLPDEAFIALGAPALFHVLAVLLHRAASHRLYSLDGLQNG